MEIDRRLPNPENGPGITVLVTQVLTRKGIPCTEVILLLKNQALGVYDTSIGQIGITRIEPARHSTSPMLMDLDCTECPLLLGTSRKYGKPKTTKTLQIHPDGWGYYQVSNDVRMKVKGRHAVTNSEEYEAKATRVPNVYKDALQDWESDHPPYDPLRNYWEERQRQPEDLKGIEPSDYW